MKTKNDLRRDVQLDQAERTKRMWQILPSVILMMQAELPFWRLIFYPRLTKREFCSALERATEIAKRPTFADLLGETLSYALRIESKLSKK